MLLNIQKRKKFRRMKNAGWKRKVLHILKCVNCVIIFFYMDEMHKNSFDPFTEVM